MYNQQLSVQLICFNLFIKKLHYANIDIVIIKITTIPMNLPHPPTSAYFHQDRALRIQAVRLLPEHLRHIQSKGQFLILLPLYCSLSVKSSLHKCIRQCCYGEYCINHIHFICPLFIDFLKAFQSVYQWVSFHKEVKTKTLCNQPE